MRLFSMRVGGKCKKVKFLVQPMSSQYCGFHFFVKNKGIFFFCVKIANCYVLPIFPLRKPLHHCSIDYYCNNHLFSLLVANFYFDLVPYQFEISDDPLEKITTSEAIRTLTDFYRTSQYCYSAIEKVNEISKVVSVLQLWLMM